MLKQRFQLVNDWDFSIKKNYQRNFLGWFVDDTTSTDINADVFAEALAAAINLTDKFIWPKYHFSFQSVYENVSVSIRSLEKSFLFIRLS